MRDRVIFSRTLLDDLLSKVLIVIGYVGCGWFWLDLIQAVSLTAKLKSPDGNIRAFLYMRFLIRPLLIISHAIHYLSNQILVAMYPFAIGIDANVRCNSDNLFFVQNIAQCLVLSTSFAIISHQ